jgi:hypothetical protein
MRLPKLPHVIDLSNDATGFLAKQVIGFDATIDEMERRIGRDLSEAERTEVEDYCIAMYGDYFHPARMRVVFAGPFPESKEFSPHIDIPPVSLTPQQIKDFDIRRWGLTNVGNLPVYSFNYRSDKNKNTYEGVMADDVLKVAPDAVFLVLSNRVNCLAVDYAMLGIEMRRVA